MQVLPYSTAFDPVCGERGGDWGHAFRRPRVHDLLPEPTGAKNMPVIMVCDIADSFKR